MVLKRISGYYSILVCSLKFVLGLHQNICTMAVDLWLKYSVYIWVIKIMRITHYFIIYVQQHCLMHLEPN